VVSGWRLAGCRWSLLVIVLFLTPAGVGAQAPAPAPSTVPAPLPASAAKSDAIQRVAELIAKSSGPYKQIAPGIWETTYQGKNLTVIRVRIAAAEDGVFFMVPLFARDKLALSQAFLLRVAEFNAEYDYVKLALDKTSLVLRLDSYASLMDVAAFSNLEGQAALAADQAYAIVRNMLPPTAP
jgi:hypothetical protein